MDTITDTTKPKLSSAEEIREVFQGEIPNHKEAVENIKGHLLQMPRQFRKQLYLWLAKEFGVAKWD